MCSGIKNVAKSIGAENRTAVNAYSFADTGSGVKSCVGKQSSVLADRAILTDEVQALENGSGADFDAFSDDAMGADVSCGINLG